MPRTAPAPSPAPHYLASSPARQYRAPSPAPGPPGVQFAWTRPQRHSAEAPPGASRGRGGGGLSPPLVAMIAVVGTAFLIVLYVRLISRPLRRILRRRPPPLPPSPDHNLFPSSSSRHHFSPYGLDESAIKALPIAFFSPKHYYSANRDCAVCLVEFDSGDALRTLPLCSHAFHSECIDTWLRSQANCPLCRAPIFSSPLRSSRIRPSFDDFLLLPPPPPPPLLPLPPEPPAAGDPGTEIAPALDDEPRGILLTRSYSFGFERTLHAAAEPYTTPWRHRHRGIWSKRWASPFYAGSVGGGAGAGGGRVFSFRSYRRSPFQRRRGSFLPLSESRAAPASRRARSMTSPVAFFGGRGRSGDPEALVSPERLNRR